MTEDSSPKQNMVRQWISTMVTEPIHYTKACDEQFSREYWPHLRVIFKRLCDEGLIESVGGKDGMYRPVDNHAKPLDWQGYDAKSDSGLILPFGLREYVMIYPDTVCVVAGSKSSGKTGFLYRTVVLNMNQMNVVLLTNLEGGILMLRDRFNAMDIEIPSPAPFRVLHVSSHFHDYIKEANTLYVVDYIDPPENEFYKVGSYIRAISNKLQGLNSLAVVGLQKPSNRDTAFGGDLTLQVATLYIAMDSKKLKIVDAKVPAIKTIHPKNMQWTFDYDDEGTRFTNIKLNYEEW